MKSLSLTLARRLASALAAGARALPAWVGLLVALLTPPVRAQDAPRQPLPPGRFLFIVATSLAMRPRAPGVAQTVESLLRSELDGRLRPGDTIGVWTFNEEVYAGRFPLQTWSPATRRAVTASVLEFLKPQRYEKNADLAKALAKALPIAAESAALSLILLTDGAEPVRGTPFDAAINAAFQELRGEQERTRLPLVTVLRAEHGRFVSHVVGQPPWRVEIPLSPSEQAARAAARARTPQPTPAELRAALDAARQGRPPSVTKPSAAPELVEPTEPAPALARPAPTPAVSPAVVAPAAQTRPAPAKPAPPPTAPAASPPGEVAKAPTPLASPPVAVAPPPSPSVAATPSPIASPVTAGRVVADASASAPAPAPTKPAAPAPPAVGVQPAAPSSAPLKPVEAIPPPAVETRPAEAAPALPAPSPAESKPVEAAAGQRAPVIAQVEPPPAVALPPKPAPAEPDAPAPLLESAPRNGPPPSPRAAAPAAAPVGSLPVQEALAVPPPPFLSGPRLLVLGLGLLAVAGALLFFIVRRSRATAAPPGSLITRSLDREKHEP